MLFTSILLGFLACEQEYDKGGEVVVNTNNGSENEPSVEIDPDNPDDPNHDWDEDGYTENEGDCNDYNAGINPGIEEVYYNDIDQNCDGQSDFDADGDGHLSLNWGGDDCDDQNGEAYPGAADDPTDGIDTNCDGEADPRFVTEEIDSNLLYSNGRNAMEIDSSGRVHVVYEDDHQLWYTNSAGLGSWRTPTLIKFNDDKELATDALDAAFDSNDRMHITYTSRNSNTGAVSLKYAYMPTIGNWVGEFEIDGSDITFSTQVGYFANID